MILRHRAHSRRALTAAMLAGLPVLCPVASASAQSAKAADIVARLVPPGWESDPIYAALAAGTITADVAPLGLGQIVPDAVSHGYVIQGSELPGFEVTASAEGVAEAAAYRARLLRLGEPVPAEVRVFSLPDIRGLVSRAASTIDADPRDYLPDTSATEGLTEDDGPLSSVIVLPACSPLPELVGAVMTEAGGIAVKAQFMSAASMAGLGCNAPSVGSTPLDGLGNAAATDGNPHPTDSDEWSPAGGLGCPGYKSNNTAWYLPCSWWYHRTNDGNSARDTWGLVQYGTGKSKSTWNLYELEVQSWRQKNSADQDWVDWGPRSDATMNCQADYTAGVQVNGAYLEHTANHCEKWDISLNPGAPGGFANFWMGKKRRAERETAMTISTNTPNGYTPTDYVSFDYYAY